MFLELSLVLNIYLNNRFMNFSALHLYQTECKIKGHANQQTRLSGCTNQPCCPPTHAVETHTIQQCMNISCIKHWLSFNIVFITTKLKQSIMTGISLSKSSLLRLFA